MSMAEGPGDIPSQMPGADIDQFLIADIARHRPFVQWVRPDREQTRDTSLTNRAGRGVTVGNVQKRFRH